ncbi:putative P-loop containing nucleoside triphosphate hydrolase [Medicago truncatula]|uniref:Sulfotransferase n=1 Tax=Medicago truncatula TaxID=3880 RepID=A0A072U6T6_MEDTR|nr:cytosolic sulfotransferase 15 [Medicago truncatula]KEH21570.1 P-loop nucleoside triphosphate hydrolase superfamily protein [Medicago truncatula]RHN44103.1 putative P-loop containing nucleoside triphosphate hydrolase [Medicago truncatula]
MASTEEQSKDEQLEAIGEECKNLILSLPKEYGFGNQYFYFFQGFWTTAAQIQSIISFQNHFQAKDSDVVVATVPKSGTTWLKALTFAIINRHHFSSLHNHPLLTSNPHELVPFFELNIYTDISWQFAKLDLLNMIEPRIFGTHIPFHSLAKSIKESNCKIIYICRNPFDTFVSYWNFMNKIALNQSLPTSTLEDDFEKYCEGLCHVGPFWDHMLGYLKESKARPNKILFLKYEDLKEDINFHVKRIAEFLGCPFTQEEESNGVIENIINLCSFEKMKGLEANKSGVLGKIYDKKYFFRKGEIGDWINYLSPSMVDKLSKIIEEKLSGSGISFNVCP